MCLTEECRPSRPFQLTGVKIRRYRECMLKIIDCVEGKKVVNVYLLAITLRLILF
jgi:hypothetical protein